MKVFESSALSGLFFGAWLRFFLLLMSGIGDDTGPSLNELNLLCLPALYLLLLFVGSLPFIPLGPAKVIVIVADVLLVIFGIACFRMNQLEDFVIALPFFGAGLASHYLLWGDRSATP